MLPTAMLLLYITCEAVQSSLTSSQLLPQWSRCAAITIRYNSCTLHVLMHCAVTSHCCALTLAAGHLCISIISR